MTHRGSRVRVLLGLALQVALFVQTIPSGPLHAADRGADEIVAFNTQSHKYHCLECTWAKRCTKNCIEIPRSEAIRRGGVPCKVCGGTCRKPAESGMMAAAYSTRRNP